MIHIAYIVAHKKAEGWRSRGVKIFDLSDPAHPVTCAIMV